MRNNKIQSTRNMRITNLPRRGILFIALLSMGMFSCGKNNIENKKTLKELYKVYEDGEISECKYNGQIVYCAGINAYDAGSVVYDKEGKQIGSCIYAWGNVDSICRQLTNCETIYRVKNSIWGGPAVDKYGLGKQVEKNKIINKKNRTIKKIWKQF